jgi:hypothetical protein
MTRGRLQSVGMSAMSGLLSGRGWIVAAIAYDGSTGTDEERGGRCRVFPSRRVHSRSPDGIVRCIRPLDHRIDRHGPITLWGRLEEVAGGGEDIAYAETDNVVEGVVAIIQSAQTVARTSLYQYVKFCRMFPEIVQTAPGQSPQLLSWSHYIELLRVKDPDARA